MWILCAFGSALFAGLTAVLAKIGIQDTDSHLATAIRTVVVLIFAWGMVFLTGAQSGLSGLDTNSLLFLVLSGLATGASWLCYFRALQIGDFNKVAPVDKSSTLLTMIMAFFILGEPLSPAKIGCMVLIFAGTLLMITPKATEKTTAQSGYAWLIYALLSALFAALTSILGKIGISGIDSNLGTAIRTIVVLIMAWAMVFITGKQSQITQIRPKSWIFLCISGVATGASWLCYYRALQEGPASVVMPIDKLSILVTIAFSWLVLKEKLSSKALAGLVLLTAGTLLLLYV